MFKVVCCRFVVCGKGLIWKNNFSVISRLPVHLLMALSLQHSTQHTFQATGWFSTLTGSALVKYEWHMSQWILSNIRKNVGQAGIQTHNPWIDSWRCYQGLTTKKWSYTYPLPHKDAFEELFSIIKLRFLFSVVCFRFVIMWERVKIIQS